MSITFEKHNTVLNWVEGCCHGYLTCRIQSTLQHHTSNIETKLWNLDLQQKTAHTLQSKSCQRNLLLISNINVELLSYRRQCSWSTHPWNNSKVINIMVSWSTLATITTSLAKVVSSHHPPHSKPVKKLNVRTQPQTFYWSQAWA